MAASAALSPGLSRPGGLAVGLDDTDSVAGGCTTYAAFDVIEAGRALGLDLIGRPRLIRLNPNTPWKTRGNGAVSLRLGIGRGRPTPAGDGGSGPLLSYPRASAELPAGPTRRLLVDSLRDLLPRISRLEDPRTHPGLVVTERLPPVSLYRRAVGEIVPLPVVERILAGIGADVVRLKQGRGIVGATAALAWRPSPRKVSVEAIAYRWPERWGTPREIDRDDLRAVDGQGRGTFHTADPDGGRILAIPNSPCPVLFGVRGWRARAARDAMLGVRSETKARWLLFDSNQGSGDHLRRRPAARLAAFQGAAVRGRVAGPPRTVRGGHVLFELRARGAIVPVAAFEPTKQFRDVVRRLRVGDRLEARGSTSAHRTLHLEELRILHLVRVLVPVPPTCCSRRMESGGRGQGWRCRRCRTRRPRSSSDSREVERGLVPRTYAVPVSGRRHLSRPLAT